MDIASLKTRAFAVSAMVTGIAGSLSAVAIEFVAPDSFGFCVSITFFVGMVVGGVASILGSIFGGLFVLFVPNIAESHRKAAPGVIYGVILIAFLFLLPDGFAGLLRRIAGRLRGRGLTTKLGDDRMTTNRRTLLAGAAGGARPARPRPGAGKRRASPRPRSASAAPMRCPARPPPTRVISRCLTAMFKRLNDAGRHRRPAGELHRLRRRLQPAEDAGADAPAGGAGPGRLPVQQARHADQQRHPPLRQPAQGAAPVPGDRRRQMGATRRNTPGPSAGSPATGPRRRSTPSTSWSRSRTRRSALLYQNDDFGKDYVNGVRDVLGARFDAMVEAGLARGDRPDHRQPDRLAAGRRRATRWSAASSRASPRRPSAGSSTWAGSR